MKVVKPSVRTTRKRVRPYERLSEVSLPSSTSSSEQSARENLERTVTTGDADLKLEENTGNSLGKGCHDNLSAHTTTGNSTKSG